jgi:hypothetical protein
MQEQVLTTQQLTQYRDAIATGGLDAAKQVYAELYARGYDYAGWAKGVASGDTLTGDAALAFLQSSAMMGMPVLQFLLTTTTSLLHSNDSASMELHLQLLT